MQRRKKNKVSVPAGTGILIRTIDPIDTEKQKTGYRFTASLETNLQADDEAVATRGTTLYGRLANASSSGRMAVSSQLTLELTDVLINLTAYPLLTSTFEMKGQGGRKEDHTEDSRGTGLGALIGGIAGGGTVQQLARSPARPEEPPLQLQRRENSCRFHLNHSWNSELNNRCRCRWPSKLASTLGDLLLLKFSQLGCRDLQFSQPAG